MRLQCLEDRSKALFLGMTCAGFPPFDAQVREQILKTQEELRTEAPEAQAADPEPKPADVAESTVERPKLDNLADGGPLKHTLQA